MERWNSPAEKEARRERKTGSALKVSEKGGWIAHRESVRKKDGRARHRDGRHTAGKGRGDEGDMPKRSSRGLAAGTGVVVVVFFYVVVVDVVVLLLHLLLLLLFLLLLLLILLLLVVVASLPLAGRQAGRLFPFFLLFPIIDKTETAQYRDDAPRRGVGKRSLSTTLLS